MPDRLTRRLAEEPFLLADGATGTGLFAMGLESGAAPELWNVDHADDVAQLHADFVAAGSDIILTNSFGANRHRLKLHGAEHRVAELNKAAAAIARRAADGAPRPVIVAGSIGPTGELVAPLGPLGEDDLTEAFAEQAGALAAGGADALWIETMSAAEEMRAAARGAATAGLPFIATMTFDTAGRTMMGLAPARFVELCHGLEPRPAAFGANCGAGPAELLDSLLGMAAATAPGDVLVAKGNCGIPRFVGGELVYSGSVEVMADYARLARDAGARIVGGCCGTTAAHIRAMRRALDEHEPGQRPDAARIAAVLGRPWANLPGDTPGGDSWNDAPGKGRGRRRSGRRRS